MREIEDAIRSLERNKMLKKMTIEALTMGSWEPLSSDEPITDPVYLFLKSECAAYDLALSALRAEADANPEHRHGDLCKQAADALTELQAEVEWLKESSKIIDDKAKEVSAENKALRNELCYKCGQYREAHNGACNGCKWRKE